MACDFLSIKPALLNIRVQIVTNSIYTCRSIYEV